MTSEPQFTLPQNEGIIPPFFSPHNHGVALGTLPASGRDGWVFSDSFFPYVYLLSGFSTEVRCASFWVWSSVVSCFPEVEVLLTGAAWTGTGCRGERGPVSQPGVWSWGRQASQPGAGREGTPPDPFLGTLAQGTGSAGINDWLQLLGYKLRLGAGTFTFVSLLPTFWECSDLVFSSLMSPLPRRLQGLSTPESSVSHPSTQSCL